MALKTFLLAAALAAAASASSAGADPADDTALHFWAMRGWADAVERELGKGVNSGRAQPSPASPAALRGF